MSWKDYKYEDGTPYLGTECPEGYYGNVATMTLKKNPVIQDSKIYKWMLVFKRPQMNIRKKYIKEFKFYDNDLVFGSDHIAFTGTHDDCSKMYDYFLKEGICIRDDYNLGEFDPLKDF